MSRALLAIAVVALSTAAFAQTRNQAAAAGAAGVSSRLQAQGYKDVHDLRRMPDGKWVGEATRNGAPVTVTSDPAGTTIAR
jgi:peptidase YpeB-like protein